MYQRDSFYIEKVRKKENDAYSFLVEKHKNMVFSIALRILKNREDAEELAQDVFVKAYQSLDTFKGESRFSTWLYRIVYNAAISKTRKKRLATVQLDNNLIENYSTDEIRENIDRLDDEEQKEIIGKILGEMADDERVMITLYYFDENSVEEISQIMSLSQANVKVRLHRLRKKMLNELNSVLKNKYKETFG